MGALWGSFSALSIGLSELFGRRVVNVAGALTAAVALQFVAALTAASTLLFVASEFTTTDLLWGVLSGVGLAAGLGFYFGGLLRSSSTVVAPTVATLTAVIPFVYALIRGSEASAFAIVGAGVAFVGLAVIAAGSFDPTRLRAGMLWGVASGLGYGGGISVLVETSDTAGSWPAMSQRATSAILLIVVALIAKSSVVPPPGQRVHGLVAGVFSGMASVFMLIGLRADAPTAVVTQSMFPIFSVIVGVIYFADPVVRRQVAGIAMVLAGVAAVIGT